MKNTFEGLGFAVINEHNVTHSEMLALLSSVVDFKRYPPSYKQFVFVFSGHGKDDYLLYTNDSNPITISTKDILEKLSEAPQLAAIPKLIFIDACRGDEPNPGRLVPKGGKNVSHIIPAGGSWLVAYSTLPKQKSYEEQEKGGMWMSRLAKILRYDDSSVNDVLTIVNEELMKLYQEKKAYPLQQPEHHSTLNSRIFLQQEAMKSPGTGFRECILNS